MNKFLTKALSVVGAISLFSVLVLVNLNNSHQISATSPYLDATALFGDDRPIALKIKPEVTSVGNIDALIVNNDMTLGPSFSLVSPGFIQHDPEWIDSQTILLDVDTIYSPVTKQEKKIELPTQAPFGYGLSPNHKQLAIIGKSQDSTAMEAWILDLNSNQNDSIARFPFAGPVREVFADIKWLNNNELVMDGDLSGKPTLYKYNIENKSLNVLKQNVMMPQVSPDGQLTAVRQTDNYIIKDSTLPTHTILIGVNGDTLFKLDSFIKTIIWNKNKEHSSFLGVEPGKITKYSISQGKLKENKFEYVDGLIMLPSLSSDDVGRYLKFTINGTKIDKISQNILQ